MVSCSISGNGMVFNFTNFTNFIDKTCSFFQFSYINCHYSGFPAPGGKKSRLGFANSLLQYFYWKILIFTAKFLLHNFQKFEKKWLMPRFSNF